MTLRTEGAEHGQDILRREGRAAWLDGDQSSGDLERVCGPDAADSGYLGEIRESRLNLLALRLCAAFLRPERSGDIEAEVCGLEMLAELGGLELRGERRPPGWL